MNTHKLVIYGFLLFAITLSACKSRKSMVPKVDISALQKSNAEKLNSIQQAQVNFSSLAIKAKANLSLDGNENEVTINFRMLRDQKIWISVTAVAGLEVARAVITPDSILILNRLESIYLKKPFNYIHSFTNPQINFKTVQSILVGNVIEEAYAQAYQFDLTDGSLFLDGTNGTLAYNLAFNTLFKLTDLSITDTNASQSLKVNYVDFSMESDLMLAHHLNFKSVAGAKSISADIKYTKIEKDLALDFPFSVPKRFSVKN